MSPENCRSENSRTGEVVKGSKRIGAYSDGQEAILHSVSKIAKTSSINVQAKKSVEIPVLLDSHSLKSLFSTRTDSSQNASLQTVNSSRYVVEYIMSYV